MKISVTQSRKVKEWHDVFGGDEDCSAILHHVTYTKHKLAFLVEMSDGRSYTSTHVVSGSSDYHESLGMGDSVINDIPQFSKDIERVTFPDLSFYDGYDEYAAAELGNDRENVAIWLMYPEDREAAEREVIDNLVKQLVSVYSSECFGDEYAGFEAYIWDMIGGNVLFTN